MIGIVQIPSKFLDVDQW